MRLWLVGFEEVRMWHFKKDMIVKNAGRKAFLVGKGREQELHAIIMK